MRSITRILSLALVLTGLVSVGVGAQGTRTWNVCGGSYAGYTGFGLCASVDVSVNTITVPAPGGTTVTKHVVTFKIYNTSGSNGSFAGSMFTSIGLDNVMPTSVDVVPGSLKITGPCFGGGVCDYSSQWSVVDNKSIGGGVQVDLISGSFESKYSIGSQCAAAGQQPGHGLYFLTSCAPGGSNYVTMSFEVDEAFDPANSSLFIKAQAGYNGGSTTCITLGKNRNCEPTTVVPEPITMTLFASGLAAWGGVGFVRRRRKPQDTDAA